MNEHPIIFSTEMVKAILDGRKIMTRRVVKPQPFIERGVMRFKPKKGYDINIKHLNQSLIDTLCPYGQVGDRLWVRETWADMVCVSSTEKGKGNGESNPHYKASADSTELKILQGSWKPSIFMPRWASRITLEITEVRVERLQEITLEDVIKEGTERPPNYSLTPSIQWFKVLWDSINAKRGYGWDKNPFCCVILFRRLNNDNKTQDM